MLKTLYFQIFGTASVLLSGGLQGFLLMETDDHMSYELDPDKMEIPKCEAFIGNQQPKGYSVYLNFITVYIILIGLSFIIFFKTEMKRSNVDNESKEKNMIKTNPDV